MNELIELLKINQLTISSCESLTGGLFASEITKFSGVSSVFKGTVVSYSPDVKVNVAGVKQSVIDQFGTVSAECAKGMAIGVNERLGSDVCISFTGVAGPDPSEGKKVGLVYIGIAYQNDVLSFKKDYSQSMTRDQIRNQCVIDGVDLLKQIISK